jgi:hypothetical protein
LRPPSLGLTVKDGEKVVEGLVNPSQVADVPPVDGVRVVAEVVAGQLLQPRQLGVDLRGARGVGGLGLVWRIGVSGLIAMQ